MKKIKKLLVLLLAVSLTLAVTAVFASAEGESAGLTDAEIESLVELYSGGIYYAEDFEPGSSIRYDSVVEDKSGVIDEVTEAGGSNAVKLVGAPSANEDVTITAAADEAISGFVYETRICASNGILNVYANGINDFGDTLGNVLVVSLDFTTGTVFVQGIGDYGSPVMTVLDGVSLVADAWYSVTVIYDADAPEFKLILKQTTDEDGALLETPVTYEGTHEAVVKTLSGAKVAIAGATIGNAVIYLDDIYLYEGVELIDFSLEEAKIGPAIEQLNAALADATEAEKTEIIEKLSVFVVSRTFSAEAYAAIIKLATLNIAEYYITEYVDIVDAYNTGNLFVEKMAALDEMEAAHLLIPEIPSYSEEEDADAYATASAIKAELFRAEAEYESIAIKLNNFIGESKAFIEFMADKDRRNNTFSEIAAWVEEADSFAYDPTFYLVEGDVIWDISAATEKYAHLYNKIIVMRAQAISFIDSVADMVNEEKPFSERYEAYISASGIRFLDTRYTFVDDEKGALADAVALYEANVGVIIEIDRVCANFLSAIADAKTATDINNLNASLAKADKYDMTGTDDSKIALELTYPGIPEAIEEYNALCQRRVDEKEAADAFIAAVDIVRAATDVNALKAAIGFAKALMPEGILGGYEGYSDALSYFLGVESDLLYNETYVNSFVSTVNSLNSIPVGKAKYEAILAAEESYAKIIEIDDNVRLARAMLDAAIQAYDAAIEAANADFDKTVGDSSKIASAVAPSDAFLKVVAIVKKIFD